MRWIISYDLKSDITLFSNQIKLHLKASLLYSYTRYHEMPQKACERGFCHVIAFSQFFEMPQNRRISFSVPIWFWKWEKWDISKNWHVINFWTEKEPKMKIFDFGAFQKIRKMLSHDKILFHMLFGAFHDTPCNPRFRIHCYDLCVLTERFMQVNMVFQ